jgi:signal transduction histidine kinase
MVLRFRRSIGEEHQQLRWLAYVGAIAISMVVSITATGPIVGDESLVSNIFWTGFVFSLGLGVPIACGVAIFRFHLYDLDVVIRKTVVFTVVAVVLTSLYLAVIAVATIGNVSRILVGVILLAVTFNPVRKAARSLADRIAYGKRASSYEVLTEFSERMSETYATDDVLPRMVQILAGATGAEHAGVWLRVGGSLRLDATWPDGATGASVAMRGDDGLPTLPADDAIEVRHQGELLGALTVSMPANDPIDPAKDKLIRDLASQAGLVLRNVRLIEELRASRQRLVSAQDEERRKIERNLHDGAQQQLVALSVQVKLARAILERDPGKAAGMLDAVQGAAGEALEELRDLARGIYPPLLADQGLTVALEAQARKSPIQVSVNAGGIGRYGQDIEAAVYFCALEALQNVAKYAEAATITVQLRADDGHLTFEVTDDGRGFDRTANAYGTGLQGMTDRLDAIGGRLDVRSAPGEGTTVTGRIRTRTLSAG